MIKEKTRESWVDVVKGLAILFVVIGHVVTSYRNSRLLTEAKAFNFICDFLYAFHMPLFFVISGYLSGRSQKTRAIKIAIVRKCITYGVPYIVFSVLAVSLNFVASAVVNTQLSIKDLLLIVVYPISSLWFIYALLIISVIQLLLGGFLGKRKATYILLTVSLLVKIAAHLVSGLEMVKGSGFSQCILFDAGKYWFWYVLGENMAPAFSMERRQMLGKIPGWICAAVTVVYAGIVYALQNANIYISESVVLNVMCSSAGVLLCCIWAIKISQSRTLEYLGKQTFPIYLIHGYVISFGRIVLSKLHIPLLLGFTPLVFCTILGTVLPLVVYEISARIPGLDFVFYPGKYLLSDRTKHKK